MLDLQHITYDTNIREITILDVKTVLISNAKTGGIISCVFLSIFENWYNIHCFIFHKFHPFKENSVLIYMQISMTLQN